jgi:RNA polymerase sigma-70 factor (ECF subfamily)
MEAVASRTATRASMSSLEMTGSPDRGRTSAIPGEESLPIDVEGYYRALGPMVLRRCRRLLRDEEKAVDAMHDTFVNLIRADDRLVHQAPASLLLRIATRVCLNKLRTERRHPEDRDDEALLAIAGDEEPEARSLRRFVLQDLLGREPDSTRLMAVLHYVDGLTLEEVGREVGLSAEAVRKRLRKLRARVAERMEEDVLPEVTP